MEKYDITKPFPLPVGMYKLNKNPGYSFQLNRLVNMDLGDLDEVRRIGDQITDKKSWKSVLLAVADTEYEKGNIRSAMGFYRMVAFFMDYDDPDKKPESFSFFILKTFLKGSIQRGDRRSPRHHPLRLWLADQSSASGKKGKRHGFL